MREIDFEGSRRKEVGHQTKPALSCRIRARDVPLCEHRAQALFLMQLADEGEQPGTFLVCGPVIE